MSVAELSNTFALYASLVVHRELILLRCVCTHACASGMDQGRAGYACMSFKGQFNVTRRAADIYLITWKEGTSPNRSKSCAE